VSRFVVDTSVAIKWFLPEPHSDHARKFLTGEHELLAPDLLLAEFGSVLWKRIRGGEMKAEEAVAVLSALMEAPLHVRPSAALIAPALEIAVRTQRTVYDSLYLSLALREKAPLVTADLRLFNALQPTPLAASLLWIESLA
jgi:predicted nucleic acid-binding protein